MAGGMAGGPAAFLVGRGSAAAATAVEVGPGARGDEVARPIRSRIGQALRSVGRAWFEGWRLYVSEIRPPLEDER